MGDVKYESVAERIPSTQQGLLEQGAPSLLTLSELSALTPLPISLRMKATVLPGNMLSANPDQARP
jgi:hypothetical protein